jgi:hypothetical protein
MHTGTSISATRSLVTCLLMVGCADVRPLPNTADWWDEGVDYDVQEPIAFTPTPYADLPSGGPGISAFIQAVFPTTGLVMAPGDQYPSGSACVVGVDNQLPIDIEGIVTLHPRWYMKLRGCNGAEEKYYGNWFIEDATGGIFVVGDAKISHFDVGDRVKIRVRGVRTNFGMNMVYVHDVLEVHREARPVYYQAVDRALGVSDIGETRRVRGVVTSPPDTFGDFTVQTASGAVITVSLDAELNRRRAHPPLGSTLCVTGPVQFSFSTYSIPIMRIGQFAVVQGDQACPD